MGILENFGKWLKAMRGGAQARSHEEMAKKRKEEGDPHLGAQKKHNVDRPSGGDTDITVGPR